MTAMSNEGLEAWAAFRRIGARERATLTRLHAARFGRTVEEIIDLREEQPAPRPAMELLGSGAR